MRTNYYKTVKLLKSLKILVIAPTCFGLHKPSTGALVLCFAKVTMLTSVTYRYLKLPVLWLHILLGPVFFFFNLLHVPLLAVILHALFHIYSY